MSNKLQLIVETHEVSESDFEAECSRVLARDAEGNRTLPREEWTEAETLAYKQLQAVVKGFTWRARLVDAKTGETVFQPPQFMKSRAAADRKGLQYKRRYDRHSDFNRTVGFVKPVEATTVKPA